MSERAALEEQRTHLLAAIADLDRELADGEIDAADHAELRDDLVARAAAVLRLLDDVADAPARAPADPTGRSVAAADARGERRNAGMRPRVLVGAAVAAAVVIGLVVALGGSTDERDATESLTGDIRLGVRDQLRQALDLSVTDPLGAIQLYDEILAEQPSSGEAWAYRGWTLARVARDPAAGDNAALLFDEALADLDQAVEAEPDLADARVFRASVRLEVGDVAGAATDIAEVDDSEVPADLVPLVDALRTRIEDASGG